jgi:hypothetical protein
MDWLNISPKKNKNLAWRIIDGEAVIIPLANQPKEGQRIDILNATATRIWELCSGKNSTRHIIALLKDEYDAPATVIESAVKRIISELSKEKLILIKEG